MVTLVHLATCSALPECPATFPWRHFLHPSAQGKRLAWDCFTCESAFFCSLYLSPGTARPVCVLFGGVPPLSSIYMQEGFWSGSWDMEMVTTCREERAGPVTSLLATLQYLCAAERCFPWRIPRLWMKWSPGGNVPERGLCLPHHSFFAVF